MLCLTTTAPFKWQGTSLFQVSQHIYIFMVSIVFDSWSYLKHYTSIEAVLNFKMNRQQSRYLVTDRVRTHKATFTAPTMVTDPCPKVHDFAFLCFIAF